MTDQVNTTAFNIDIPYYTTDTTVRFSYDATGNLSRDLLSNQEHIYWNLYGKVTESDNPVAGLNLKFSYEGGGHRVAKSRTRKVEDTLLRKEDIYVRDAQGNTLAVYETERKYKMDHVYHVYEIINNALRTALGNRLFIDSFLAPSYTGIIDGPYISKSVSNSPSWAETYTAGQTPAFYLEQGKLGDLLLGTDAYLPTLLEYNEQQSAGLIEKSWEGLFNENNYPSDGENNTLNSWVNALYLRENTELSINLLSHWCGIDSAEAMLSALHEGLTGYPADSLACEDIATAIVNQLEPTNTENLATAYKTIYTQHAGLIKDYLSALATDPNFYENEDLYSAGDNLFEAQKYWLYYLSGSDSAGKAGLIGYFDQRAETAEDLDHISTTQELAQLLYRYQPGDYIYDYSEAQGYHLIDTVLGETPGVTEGGHLAFIRKRMDPGLATQVDVTLSQAEVRIKDRIWLAEHHLYGSSRLGMRRYPSGAFYNSWDYTGETPEIDTNLQVKQPWYSAEYNDVIQAGYGEPYGHTQTQTFKMQHTLGAKGYELTNHLGNVQAVVTDKRVEQDINDDDTVDVYAPALTAAYDYYPFGMLMPGRYVRDTSLNDWRFGYQTQEKVNEIAGVGNHYTALFWEYDPRTARRWNLDPKPHFGISDYSAFGGNPISNIDHKGDYFFGLIGSTSGQRKAARSFANEHNGTIKNITKKSISVDYTAGYFYTDIEDNGGYVADKRSQSFNTDGSLFQPTIREFKPNLMDKWGASKSFVGKVSYDWANGLFQVPQLATQSFAGGFYNLDGTSSPRGSKEQLGNFFNGATSFVPAGEASLGLAYLKKINAAQFSQIFKGTTISSASPAFRGAFNRGINKYIIPFWNNNVPTGSAVNSLITVTEYAKEEQANKE